MLGRRSQGGRAIFIGPFPPPHYGQSIATRNLADSLAALGMRLDRVDVSKSQWADKLVQHADAAVRILRGNGPCYISLNSNAGMWLSSVLALLARLRGRQIFLHHHAYDHVRRRRVRMVATALMAGPQATHIVLGPRMAQDLAGSTPEVRRTFILNNAGLVAELERGWRTGARIVLGHLSNLSVEKGIAVVVDAAVGALRAGHDIELRVAGPCTDAFAEAEIGRARDELGDRFAYFGPVSGAAKESFLQSLDVFLFPSQYKNEAEPLVILEALAAAVPCVTTSLGCIPDDIGATGGICVDDVQMFGSALTAYLAEHSSNHSDRRTGAMRRFGELLVQHRSQITSLAKQML